MIFPPGVKPMPLHHLIFSKTLSRSSIIVSSLSQLNILDLAIGTCHVSSAFEHLELFEVFLSFLTIVFL